MHEKGLEAALALPGSSVGICGGQEGSPAKVPSLWCEGVAGLATAGHGGLFSGAAQREGCS